MFKNFKKVLKNNRGFTLIELIAVIAILGILMAIAVPRIIGFSDQARRQADRQQTAIVANSAKMLIATGDAVTTQTGTNPVNTITLTTTAGALTVASEGFTFPNGGDMATRMANFAEVNKGLEHYSQIVITFGVGGDVTQIDGTLLSDGTVEQW